jgi:hypothetical protein
MALFIIISSTGKNFGHLQTTDRPDFGLPPSDLHKAYEVHTQKKRENGEIASPYQEALSAQVVSRNDESNTNKTT